MTPRRACGLALALALGGASSPVGAAEPETPAASSTPAPAAPNAAPEPVAPEGARARRSGPRPVHRPSTELPVAVSGPETAQALRIVLALTVLAILPALLISLTAFLRIIIVLSMLRHAVGMNETPPNAALTGIALFLTLFTMAPVLQQVNQEGLQPFLSGKASLEASASQAMAPLRDFMVRQTREQDLALMVELSRARPPQRLEEVSYVQLVPAFMISELRAAYQIGFVVFLPFLLIDLVVSSVLMALGMMMMPPTTVSLPLKILMFVLIDGWSMLLKALVGSFR